jgi:hypothetical protein
MRIMEEAIPVVTNEKKKLIVRFSSRLSLAIQLFVVPAGILDFGPPLTLIIWNLFN